MGYACPVCDHPQADAVHLANHLAFTALSRGGDHEAWLNDRVPEWEELGEEGLAEHVTEYADEREYPQVFEDTTGQHDHSRDGDASGGGSGTESVPDAMLAEAERRLADEETPDTEEVLAEARRLTSERREDSETE